MFDIGWSEILVIAIVMVVVVGPKDLPRMLRAFGRATTKLRAQANEFRRNFDEALKEAELDGVRDVLNEARSLDPTRDIKKALNPVKAIGEEIRSSLQNATSVTQATTSETLPGPSSEVLPVPAADSLAPAPLDLTPSSASERASAAAPAKKTSARKTSAKPAAKKAAASAAKPAPKRAPAKSAATAAKEAPKKAVARKPRAAKPADETGSDK